MSNAQPDMIRATNVSKAFGSLEVLKGVDLSVRKGEIISIIGPSGSGKSTLLRTLIHLEKADGGEILVEGEAIRNADDSHISDARSVNVAANWVWCFKTSIFFLIRPLLKT